jgi:predicted aspartyl protease
MKKANRYSWAHLKIAVLLIAVAVQPCALGKMGDPNWQREEVNWRMPGGSKIKAIDYPQEKKAPLSHGRHAQKPRKKLITIDATKQLAAKDQISTGYAIANVIDSPAVDGFVPWIAVSVTDQRGDEGEVEAVIEEAITGGDLTGTPENDYIIGIYDTGASAHVMGNAAGIRTGIFGAGLTTSNESVISGVTGETTAWISQPLGIFIDGLGAIDPDGLLWDRSNMVGQSNVAIMVGEGFEEVDLPTAIGSPLSAYFTAVFNNETQITVTHDGNDFNGPDIRIYPQDDSRIPTYANTIPLELRPLGGVSAQYMFLNIDDPFNLEPMTPSVIFSSIGNPDQSVFFVASVDLYQGVHTAIDKTRFMFDTGAQITVIGSRVASRLGINPAFPDFEVEIVGVTGVSIMAPGFYIDEIDIPALGEWLTLTNVPVVLLDVPSPEGGTADGIIGMNLFTDLNFVLRGGGLFLQDDPMVYYQPISRLAGDITGDGIIDWADIQAMGEAWLAIPASPNWDAKADLKPDEIINFLDFAVLAQNWQ